MSFGMLMKGSLHTPVRTPWVMNGSVEQPITACLALTAGRIAELAVSTKVTSLVASRFHFFRR